MIELERHASAMGSKRCIQTRFYLTSLFFLTMAFSKQ